MDMSHGKGFIVLSMCLVIWKAVNFINSPLVSLFTYLIHLSFPMIDSHCRGASRISSKEGAHLKKLRRAEGGTKMFGVFRVKNHDFTPKNHIFSNFRGGARRVRHPPPTPWIRPCIIHYFGTEHSLSFIILV